MDNPLKNKTIVLGITGSIAAYKAADIASRLTKTGAHVESILTSSAEKFISPLTIQSVTGKNVYVDRDLWGNVGHVVHIQLGRKADFYLVAPATANTIAKLANGIADNLLTVTALAAGCPICIAPAMDSDMFHHHATQENIKRLVDNGTIIIGPEIGHLASGLEGPGRMSDPQEIINQLQFLASRSNPLKNKKIVVTAGGTQEAIDPVRVLTNRSSGKQGYALAQSALNAGANVVLISAPTALSAPTGAKLILVVSAEDMRQSVLAEIGDADALVMAAAVSDFRPTEFQNEKIKKDSSPSTLQLSRTEDILKEVAAVKKKKKLDLKVIGFAAESQQLVENATKKMRQKNMDLIVANDITEPNAGFGVDTNKVLLIYSDGSTEQLPLMNKTEVAEKVINHALSLLNEGVG